MKKAGIIGCLLIFNFTLWAQESGAAQKTGDSVAQHAGIAQKSADDPAVELELPEVTTVITGESVKAGADSLPSFDDVVVLPENSGEVVPVLPEVSVDAQVISEAAAAKSENKNIYAEGQLGGGYPSLFTGDFSVYRQNENPFELTFHHNSMSGFANKSLTEGYNTRSTSMSAKRTFVKDNFEFSFAGLYESLGNGLQNKVLNISDVNNDLVVGSTKLSWTLPKGFVVGGGLQGDFYNRYADITYVNNFACPAWIQKATSYDVEPEVFALWSGNGFKVLFDGSYWFGGLEPCETAASLYNRGNFGLDFNWTGKNLKLYANAALVCGNTFDESVLVPFTAGLEAALPVSFANRNLSFAIEGGLSSYRNKIEELEKQFRFTGFSKMPSESSDWYGKIDFSLPVKTSFSCDLSAEYKTTAFNNGTWLPQYNTTSEYGIYGFESANTSFFTTSLNCTYLFKDFSFAAGWQSNWLDIPALEWEQLLLFNVVFQEPQSKYGVNLLCKIPFGAAGVGSAGVTGTGTAGDIVPVINLDGFFRVTPAVRIVLAAQDIIKLCTGQTRVYAGQYAAESGSISCLVKFFF